MQGIPKGKKTQFEESEQVSEPYKAGMLGLSYQEFKTSIINILKDLMDKTENMQQQMGNVNRDMEILIKNQKRNARD